MKILLIVSLIGLVGCAKQIDRLAGGDSNEETCAKYPWVCGVKPGDDTAALPADPAFCGNHPELDTCGGPAHGPYFTREVLR